MTFQKIFTGRTALLGAALIGLSACGGSDAPQAESAASAPAEAPAEAAPAAPAATTAAAGEADGAAIYQQVCLVCHQQDGNGMPGAFPPLDGSTWVTGNPEVPISILIHGMTGPVDVNGTTYAGVMLPYGNAVPMSDEEMAAVLTYVRTSWSNSASEITAEEVAAVREATADRSTPYMADELSDAR